VNTLLTAQFLNPMAKKSAAKTKEGPSVPGASLGPKPGLRLHQNVRAMKTLRVGGALVVNFGDRGTVQEFVGSDKPRISIAW